MKNNFVIQGVRSGRLESRHGNVTEVSREIGPPPRKMLLGADHYPLEAIMVAGSEADASIEKRPDEMTEIELLDALVETAEDKVLWDERGCPSVDGDPPNHAGIIQDLRLEIIKRMCKYDSHMARETALKEVQDRERTKTK